MADAKVFHEVREQISDALLYTPRPTGTPARRHEVAAGHAALAALDEIAAVLRARAQQYAEQGGHDAAHALWLEAERFATHARPIPRTA